MMHQNSLEAYQTIDDLGDRQVAIYRTLMISGPMTDRAVAEEMGFGDMNSVRPRITELVHAGFAKEVGNVHCHVTGRKVRLVRSVSQAERWNDLHQLTFF